MSDRLRFGDASAADVPAITALQNATAGALTGQFGFGPWSATTTERGTAANMRNARFRLGRLGRQLVTVLRLTAKKPWSIDARPFTPVRRPLYLTNMAVAVAWQRLGHGRAALDDAVAVARAWPADAIRLDAWDAPAGAGGFYAGCGFQECGRIRYKSTALVYYARTW